MSQSDMFYDVEKKHNRSKAAVTFVALGLMLASGLARSAGEASPIPAFEIRVFGYVVVVWLTDGAYALDLVRSPVVKPPRN